jgi:hypothetical protein
MLHFFVCLYRERHDKIIVSDNIVDNLSIFYRNIVDILSMKTKIIEMKISPTIS